jgi:hypothetical protein
MKVLRVLCPNLTDDPMTGIILRRSKRENRRRIDRRLVSKRRVHLKDKRFGIQEKRNIRERQ